MLDPRASVYGRERKACSVIACNFGTKIQIDKSTGLFDTSNQRSENMSKTGDKDRTIRLSWWVICAICSNSAAVRSAAAVRAADG